MDDADILFERRGRLGLVTLNRPKALNALTHDMLLRLERQLDLWREDHSIEVVAIQGAGDKAFCAGGDIRALYDAGRPGGENGRNNFKFYADEYRMNTKIMRFPKPYVSLMDGVVMGGGVGVSIHGSVRIATERTVFAMPETGIGLFPDVGGTYFLPRLPGQTGLWLGLTGARLRGGETVGAGICDLQVRSDSLPVILDYLSRHGGNINTGPLFGEFDIDEEMEPRVWYSTGGYPSTANMASPFKDDMHAAYSGASVEEILDHLKSGQTEWGRQQRDAILAKSPTCTRIAFRQIREGAALEFEDCMRLEYRLARFCMTRPDFYEGVRAVILDKDNAPKWSPATLAEAGDAHVAPAFAPLGDEELILP